MRYHPYGLVMRDNAVKFRKKVWESKVVSLEEVSLKEGKEDFQFGIEGKENPWELCPIQLEVKLPSKIATKRKWGNVKVTHGITL